MNSLKMKDLLVSIYPEDPRHQQGKLLSETHFMAMPKCTQPSKAMPFAVGAAPGPTKESIHQNGLAPGEPCPCPSKTVEEEEVTRSMRQPLSVFSHPENSSANTLAELKKALAAMQASSVNQ